MGFKRISWRILPFCHWTNSDSNITVKCVILYNNTNKVYVGGRHDMPTTLSSPWAPKRLAPPSRRQRSSSFPRPTRSHAHRCSCLTSQHGGEQSGLVTLTFDLESSVRVTCDVCYLCANFGLPRPLCSRLRPDVRDRQTDVRRASSL